ncbi:MAG: peptide chain release factor N(5)-glutamine methyltransferase [Acidobacteriota bacterium]
MERTLGALVADARRRFRKLSASFEIPPREALLLAGHVLGWSESRVLAYPEHILSPAEAARFEALLGRRLSGEPFAYLTGEREFYGRPFTVDRRVLIPRPETEHLVEAALALALPAAPRILDIGTGSGCIAVTLALELPGCQAVAADRSLDALRVVQANVRRHRVDNRVAPVKVDLAAALDLSSFDLVVSNPPYVDPADTGELSPEILDFEPASALFAERRGLALIEDLIQEATAMAPGTWMLLEIGRGQAPGVERHAASRDWDIGATISDYAGIARVVQLRRPR